MRINQLSLLICSPLLFIIFIGLEGCVSAEKVKPPPLKNDARVYILPINDIRPSKEIPVTCSDIAIYRLMRPLFIHGYDISYPLNCMVLNNKQVIASSDSNIAKLAQHVTSEANYIFLLELNNISFEQLIGFYKYDINITAHLIQKDNLKELWKHTEHNSDEKIGAAAFLVKSDILKSKFSETVNRLIDKMMLTLPD